MFILSTVCWQCSYYKVHAFSIPLKIWTKLRNKFEVDIHRQTIIWFCFKTITIQNIANAGKLILQIYLAIMAMHLLKSLHLNCLLTYFFVYFMWKDQTHTGGCWFLDYLQLDHQQKAMAYSSKNGKYHI